MAISFPLADLLECAFDSESLRARLGKRKVITPEQAFAAGASISDLLKVVARLGHNDLCVRFALACAYRAAKHTNDPHVQECLEATENYVASPSSVKLVVLRKVCESSRSASEARDTATAAAYAAAARNATAPDARTVTDYAGTVRAAGNAVDNAAVAAYSANERPAYLAAFADSAAYEGVFAACYAAGCTNAGGLYGTRGKRAKAKEEKAQQALFIEIFR